jgi:DNA-binding MarR family transcriptional regulator
MKDEPNGIEIKIMMKLKEKQYCIEDLGKDFSLSFNWVYKKVASLKKRGFILERENEIDKRRKDLILTKEGLLYLAKLEARKSAIAKLDSWLDKKFTEIGIDCERLFK